jgi:hypothetical protein
MHTRERVIATHLKLLVYDCQLLGRKLTRYIYKGSHKVECISIL